MQGLKRENIFKPILGRNYVNWQIVMGTKYEVLPQPEMELHIASLKNASELFLERHNLFITFIWIRDGIF
jgi:hypothetical protein